MPDVFDGYEGTRITEKDATDLTSRYRDNFPDQKKGYFFGRHKIHDMVSQEGSLGLRIYFGQNDHDELTLVIVAADADGNDMLDAILDTGIGCPDICGDGNALNS